MFPSTARKVLSTSIYITGLFFALWANHLLINRALKTIINPFFGWFYHLALFIRIMLVVFAGSISLIIILGVFMWLGEIVGRALARIFIFNRAAYYISIVMVFANIIASAMDMWAFIQWDFCSVMVWLLIFYSVTQMNWVLVFQDKPVLDEAFFLQEIANRAV